MEAQRSQIDTVSLDMMTECGILISEIRIYCVASLL